MASGIVQQLLSDKGVKVMSFSSRYKHKLIRLEDLRELPKSPEEGI
jgi:ubiquinone biosynthesis protein Coq4